MTLRGEGLVRSSPHRGFIVEPLDRGDIVDIFWMQAELSARLATNAVSNPDLPAHLATLTGLVDEFDDAVAAGDQRRVLLTEFAFHREINLAGDSKKLAWFVHAASKYNPHELYTRDPQWRRQAAASHRRLVGHLRRRDHRGHPHRDPPGFRRRRDRLIDQLESIGFFDEQSRAKPRPPEATHLPVPPHTRSRRFPRQPAHDR